MSHERDVHKEKPNGVIIGTVQTISLYLGSETCPICNESYKTNKNLRNHLKYKHGYYTWSSEGIFFAWLTNMREMCMRRFVTCNVEYVTAFLSDLHNHVKGVSILR